MADDDGKAIPDPAEKSADDPAALAAIKAAADAAEDAAAIAKAAAADEAAKAAARDAAKAAEEAAKAKPAPHWAEERLRVETAKRREAEAELEKLKKGAASPATTTGPQPGTPEFDALVRQEAQKQSATAEFERQATEAMTAGRAAFPDFDAKISELKRLVPDPNDLASLTSYNEMILAAFETGEAPKLLHELGSDLNRAAQIMALPPVKRAVALTRMAAGQGEKISTLPKPIATVGGTRGSHEAIDPSDPRSDGITTATWMRRRQEQIRKANGGA